jgi:hypothetical protein
VQADLPPETQQDVAAVTGILSAARASITTVRQSPVIKIDRAYAPQLSRLDAPLRNPYIGQAVRKILTVLEPTDWPAASLLRQILLLWQQRQPVSDRLMGIFVIYP